jgi:trehalose-6-phosphate synthase
LLVNPRDVDALKNVMVEALRMREKDRRMRMAVLRSQVRRHDVFQWAQTFLEALAE